MYAILLTIFLLVCLALIIVVLMQSSKGGGLAGAFGGSSDAALLGGRSAGNLLSRATGYLAGSFIVLALVLSLMSSRQGSGQIEEGVIARQQREAASNQLDVAPGASILDEIQTEGMTEDVPPAESGEAPAESGGDEPVGEPQPSTP